MLSPERVATSTVQGRVVFIVATPETGAERVQRALGSLPGVTSAGVPTHLFSQGLGALLDTWLSRTRDALGDRADDDRFLGDVRLLADAPLAARLAAAGAERIVEYSPGHIPLVGPMLTLYPDAQFVHLVRDGRQVAARLASPLLAWPPHQAARQWCDDQGAVLALGSHDNLHVLRMEDVLEDPPFFLGAVAERVGIACDDEDMARAAAVLGDCRAPADTRPGRVATLVESAGREILSTYGYDAEDIPWPRRLAAQAELGAAGEMAWAVRSAITRARAAGRDG
ncbi:MAG: sulfotransferase family protein [Acidimicrobiales bacterium]|nr:sulfotransferase family protein [Acidimicrobiales bacterium]